MNKYRAHFIVTDTNNVSASEPDPETWGDETVFEAGDFPEASRIASAFAFGVTRQSGVKASIKSIALSK